MARDLEEVLGVLRGDPRAAVQELERLYGQPMISKQRNSWSTNDAQAIIALRVGNFRARPINSDALSLISVPCLVYCGDLDPAHARAKESANHIPGVTFISMPGLAHETGILRIDLTLPIVKKFLAEVAKGGAA